MVVVIVDWEREVLGRDSMTLVAPSSINDVDIRIEQSPLGVVNGDAKELNVLETPVGCVRRCTTGGSAMLSRSGC